MSDFVLPRYSSGALSNLLPSITARLDGRTPVIDVPRAPRYVVLLVDGLGLRQLEEYADDADRLAALPRQQLTCSVPSTTATSLTSLGCGSTPGRHGLVGYSFYEPTVEAVVNALSWENGPDPIDGFRQERTLFREMEAEGRSGGAVTLGRFADSALTQLAFDGTTLYPRVAEGDVEESVSLVADALEHHDVVYCYERLLDHTGHGHGVGSWQWLEQLAFVDDLVAALTGLASSDVCVLVTGDHGMINVPMEHRVVIEAEPALDGYHHVAGESRFRQVYTDDAPRLASAWREFLGERAVVLTRDEAIEAGWFGDDVTAASRARIGDVVAALREDWALMSLTAEREFNLIGMHGSLTADEMFVPLSSAGGER